MALLSGIQNKKEMAREIKTIYNEMIAEKATMSSLNGLQPASDNAANLLSDLSSGSKVAMWRLLFYIMAVGIWIHEKIFDTHKAAIELRAAELYVGTVIWYHAQCFLFQFGDTLTWNGTKYNYSTITPANQIIKRASVTEVAGQLVVKVAKLSAGLPIKLTATELNAFTAYLTMVKFAGTNLSVISRDADLLKIYYSVKYDPLVLSASGELLSTAGVYPVQDAINSYIQNLPFDGNLNLTQLTDEIQKAQGVIDPVVGVAEAKYGTLPYSTIVNNYNADAGHMAIDPAFPLSTSITYNV